MSHPLTEMEIRTRQFDSECSATFMRAMSAAATTGIPSPMEIGNMTHYLWHHGIMGDLPDWQSLDSMSRVIDAMPGLAKWPPRTVQKEVNNFNEHICEQMCFLWAIEQPYCYSDHFNGLGKVPAAW